MPALVLRWLLLLALSEPVLALRLRTRPDDSLPDTIVLPLRVDRQLWASGLDYQGVPGQDTGDAPVWTWKQETVQAFRELWNLVQNPDKCDFLHARYVSKQDWGLASRIRDFEDILMVNLIEGKTTLYEPSTPYGFAGECYYRPQANSTVPPRPSEEEQEDIRILDERAALQPEGTSQEPSQSAPTVQPTSVPLPLPLQEDDTKEEEEATRAWPWSQPFEQSMQPQQEEASPEASASAAGGQAMQPPQEEVNPEVLSAPAQQTTQPPQEEVHPEGSSPPAEQTTQPPQEMHAETLPSASVEQTTQPPQETHSESLPSISEEASIRRRRRGTKPADKAFVRRRRRGTEPPGEAPAAPPPRTPAEPVTPELTKHLKREKAHGKHRHKDEETEEPRNSKKAHEKHRPEKKELHHVARLPRDSKKAHGKHLPKEETHAKPSRRVSREPKDSKKALRKRLPKEEERHPEPSQGTSEEQEGMPQTLPSVPVMVSARQELGSENGINFGNRDGTEGLPCKHGDKRQCGKEHYRWVWRNGRLMQVSRDGSEKTTPPPMQQQQQLLPTSAPHPDGFDPFMNCIFQPFSSCQQYHAPLAWATSDLMYRQPKVYESAEFGQLAQGLWNHLRGKGLHLQSPDSLVLDLVKNRQPETTQLTSQTLNQTDSGRRKLGILRALLASVAFKPSAFVRRRIRKLEHALARPPGPMLVVHVRRTDKWVEQGTPLYTRPTWVGDLDVIVALIKKAESVTQRNYTSFYLISDDPSVYHWRKMAVLRRAFREHAVPLFNPYIDKTFSNNRGWKRQGHMILPHHTGNDIQLMADIYYAAKYGVHLVGCGRSGISQFIAQLLGAKFKMDPNMLALFEDDEVLVKGVMGEKAARQIRVTSVSPEKEANKARESDAESGE